MEFSQEDRDLLDPQGATTRSVVSEATEIAEELTNLNPYIEIYCKEDGDHTRNGGWRLGMLKALSINDERGTKPWEAEGISRATWYRRQNETNGEISPSVSKISSRAYARQAGIDHKTVIKYLNTWNLAAADGMPIPKSSDMVPGQEIDLAVTDDNGKLIFSPEAWKKYFQTPSGNEKNEFVSLVNKIHTAAGMDTSGLTAQNFDGQLDHSVDTVKEDGQALIRIGQEIVARCDAITEQLESHVFID